MSKAQISDRDATEIVEAEFEEQRMKAIGAAHSIPMTWGDNWALEMVPTGQFADRVADYIEQADPATLVKWRDANRIGLQQFWAKHPSDALALKKLIEAKAEKVAA